MIPVSLIVAILLLATVIITILLISHYDTTHFTVTEYEAELKGLKSPVMFCVISDVHEQIYGEDNSPLISKVAEKAPDGILIAGDLITAHGRLEHQDYRTMVSLVERLAKIAPVYIAEGNHEHKLRTWTFIYGDWYTEYQEQLRKAGAILLSDGDVILDEGIHIRGLDADIAFFKKVTRTPMPQEYLVSELGDPDPVNADLLVAHNPVYFDEYAAWGADMVIAGHVHGGIVRLPFIGGVISPMLRLFPRYDGGLYPLNGSQMVVSRGLGTHTIRFRLFNQGELIFLNLVPDTSGNRSRSHVPCS